MGWNAQIGKELRGLDGIVAILFSLAGLAERAAGASDPVRCAVLWFLRQADAVATEFVAASACAARLQQSQRATADRDGSDPVDAINLASSLRMLALAVEALVAQLRHQAFLHRGQPSGVTSFEHRWHGILGIFEMADSPAAQPNTS